MDIEMINTKYYDGFEGESFVEIYYINKQTKVGMIIWHVFLRELLEICYNEVNFIRKDGLLAIYKQWDNYFKYYDAPSIHFKAIKIKNIKIAINEIDKFKVNPNLSKIRQKYVLNLRDDLVDFFKFANENNKQVFFKIT